MSAFNVVKYVTQCPECGATFEQGVQFRYGRVWQLNYNVGDTLQCGRNSVGLATGKAVVGGAGVKACPNCGHLVEDYYVKVENSVISKVEPANGQFNFIDAAEGWIEISSSPLNSCS